MNMLSRVSDKREIAKVLGELIIKGINGYTKTMNKLGRKNEDGTCSVCALGSAIACLRGSAPTRMSFKDGVDYLERSLGTNPHNIFVKLNPKDEDTVRKALLPNNGNPTKFYFGLNSLTSTIAGLNDYTSLSLEEIGEITSRLVIGIF